MEAKRAQKRPHDLNSVLDENLQFASWDSDSESSTSPEKKPRLFDDDAGNNPHSSKQQFKDASVSSGHGETRQYQNGHGEGKMGSEEADSPDTVVLSEEEAAEGEGDQALSRASTMEKGGKADDNMAPVEGGIAAVPASSNLLWKDTSLEKDAGIVTSIIPDANMSAVMECLARHRAHPDRLNVVVAAMLDTASSAAADAFPGDQDGMAQTTGVVKDETAGTAHTVGHRVNSCETHRVLEGHENHTAGKSGSHIRLNDSHADPGEKQGRAVEGGEGSRAVNGQNTQQDSGEDGSSLYRDVKAVIVKVKQKTPQAAINATEVYRLLEQQSGQGDRVDRVCQALLKKQASIDRQNQTSSSDSNTIFNQAIKLNSEFPLIDPSEIYELLEKEGSQENAVQTVRETLRALTGKAETSSRGGVLAGGGESVKPPMAKEDSISNDPLVRNDPVFRDMRIISRMFPERDQNELYALVEAHYYRQDRVQAVIEELLHAERNSQDKSLPLSPPLTPHAGGEPVSTPAFSKEDIAEGLLHAEVDHLRDIFPDCDPNYIYERLEACKETPDRVKVIAAEMFEKKEYPRLKDVQEKQTKAARKRRLQNMEFTMEEFLAKFPDPSTTFRDVNKEMKDNYRSHVDSQLKHDFPDLRHSYLTSVVDKHHHHLLPIITELEATRADILARGGRSKKLRDVPKEFPLEYPEEPDEYFFYELWYTLNEQRVKDHFEQQAALRKARVEEARAQNELYECRCCFEDECLFEDMNACADGHLFCRQCIARSAEAAFGEGKTTFPCLTGTCEHQIPLSVLRELLPSSMFSKVLRKLQEEEVRKADIPDLVECPFCSFATIMADSEDRVFRCLNPECLKDSCRFCREPNHVPLKCEEVEKQKETDMRTFIEKRVTEAMLRKCHRCGKHFVKDVGCNKMTCICGATSCYVCREPDIDYGHFTGNNCTEGDMDRLHRQEMERAEREAREEYIRQHPEAADLELKYDPAQHIQPTSGEGMVYDEYDSDHSYDSENEESVHSDDYLGNQYSAESFSDEDHDHVQWFY